MKFHVACPYCKLLNVFDMGDRTKCHVGPKYNDEFKINCVHCNSRIGIKTRVMARGASAEVKRARRAADQAVQDEIDRVRAEPGCNCTLLRIGDKYQHLAACAVRRGRTA